MRTKRLTQALNKSSHGIKVSIRHLRRDGTHHLGAVVGTRLKAEIVQLGVNVFAVLSGQARKLDGDALALGAVAGCARRHASALYAATEDFLAQQRQFLILGGPGLGLLGAV